ncbi:fatty acid desaturase [Streptomyces sp. ODS28]|uniref:fatty acid desaturase n=1 Tax=Streptomyces sp. ODS28 TaxID=3136688 RepID=UPI0031EED00C
MSPNNGALLRTRPSSPSGPQDPDTTRPKYKRGYRNPAALKDALARAHTTRLARTAGQALFDFLSVPALLLAATSHPVRQAGPAALAAACLVALVLAARQLRGLENLVHEGSHFNWSRRHRTWNDVLTTVLAAAPTGARIADYRESHLAHHGKFGTAEDPDRLRYEELALEDMDRSGGVSGAAAFAREVLRRFGRYQRGWLATLGSAPIAAALPFAWAAVAVALPAWLLGGAAHAVAASALWLAAHLVGLPVVRFVAESSEHVYREADTVFGATVSNLGRVQRLLFHPHGDGFHTVHHLWPGIPHHQLARVHRLLLEHDPAYAAGLRYRTRVLERPRTGLTHNGEGDLA